MPNATQPILTAQLNVRFVWMCLWCCSPEIPSFDKQWNEAKRDEMTLPFQNENNTPIKMQTHSHIHCEPSIICYILNDTHLNWKLSFYSKSCIKSTFNLTLKWPLKWAKTLHFATGNSTKNGYIFVSWVSYLKWRHNDSKHQ